MKTATRTQTIQVLIVDDHPVVREGLSAVIDRAPDMSVAGAAGNGKEAIELYRQLQPEIVLMDLRMPEMDGVLAILKIREEFPSAKVIILTTYDSDEDIYHGLRAGARAYLLKDAPREDLLQAIRAVAMGQMRIPQEVAAKLAERMSGPELTARELEVLSLIVAGKSNREIGDDLYITEGTVKAHVNSILNKLDVSDRTQAVIVALKRGLLRLE
jgi:two-component system NarL family response regulator